MRAKIYPGVLTAEEVDPGADAHFFARLHHFQRFVQQDFSGQRVINDLDDSICQGESAPGRIILHAHATTESQFDDDAASESVGDIIVPK